jgi:ADP-heptose:LPS heptosyltransferase
MTINSMRRIDRILGIPLCRILSPADRLARALRRPGKKHPPSRILFIELSEMGSMVLAYTLLARTREAFPGAELYFLTFSSNRYAVDILGVIPPENVITIDQGTPFRLARSTLGALRRLRALHLDAVIDMELFARFTALLSALSGARERVGFYRYYNEGLYRGDFLTRRVALNPHIHIAFNLLNLLGALVSERETVPAPKQPVDGDALLPPRFSPTPEEQADLEERLENICPGIREARRLVLLNPNAGDLIPLRRWPERHYIELSRKLLAVDGVYLVITGTGEESPAAGRIRAGLDPQRVCNLAGLTSFRELLTLYSFSHVLITNDSGPAHFAGLTGIHTFVFFGPETPALYGPLAPNSRALYSGFACSPCVSAFNHRRSPCRDNLCLQDITPERVFSLVEPLLQAPAR